MSLKKKILSIAIAVLGLGLIAGGLWYLKSHQKPYLGQTIAVSPETSASNLQSGLVDWYKFEGGDAPISTLVDRGSGGNNLTATEMKTAPGILGESALFNGATSKYASTGKTGYNSSSSHAYAAWIKAPTCATALCHVVGNSSSGNVGTDMFVNSTNHVAFYGQGGGAGKTSSGSVTPNKWTHILASYDGVTKGVTFCINGVCEAEQVITTAWNAGTNNNIGMGNWSATGGYWLNGSLDDVRIYNRTTTAATASKLYNEGKNNIAQSNTKTLTSGETNHITFDGQNSNATTFIATVGNNGTNNGSTALAPGKFGEGLKCDGVNDYVSFTMPSSTTETNSFWIKTPVSPPAVLSGLLAAPGIYFNATGYLQVYPYTSNYFSSAATIPANKWTNIVLTTSLAGATSTAYLYINGVFSASTSIGTVATPGTTQNICLFSGKYFTGQFDDYRKWTRILSQTEITQLYNQGANQVAQSNTKTLTSGLVGYWTFDGNQTTASLFNGNVGGNLTRANGVATGPGRVGEAIRCDGVDDKATLASFATSSQRSISFWMYPKAVGAVAGAITGEPLYFSTGRILSYYPCSGASVNSSTVLPLGKWQHIVATHSVSGATSTAQIYINGVLDKTGTAAYLSCVGSLNICNYADLRPFNGMLDDFRIYNRLLTQTEITQLYNQGR